MFNGRSIAMVMVMENNLKAWRDSRELSQQQVADIFRQNYSKSSVKKQTISRWERGTLPELESALILARIYNCRVEDLWILEDD